MDNSEVDGEKRATLRRFAALGAATPVTSVLDSDQPDNNVREAITGYLTATPGAHFSKVRDDLKLGTGEAQHHLRRLLDAGLIEGHRDGAYRRFYPADRFTSFEQVALGYLRRETPRGMVIELLRQPEASAGDLAESLGVSRPTISKHAGELAQAGILDRDGHYLLSDPETLLVLLIRYADSFDSATVDFANTAAEHVTVD